MSVAEEREVASSTDRSTSTPPAAASSPVSRRSPLLIELAVIAFLGWIYDWLQNLAPVRVDLALRNGESHPFLRAAAPYCP